MSLPKIQGETARLWDQPELRFTPQGKALCSLPLVFSKRKKNAQGVWEDAGSMFVRGTAWEQLGENCAESLAKGDEVIVTGELSVREFERNDGSKGQSLELNVYAVGPSLRFNTVKVNRVERGSSKPQASGTPDGDPWPTASADPDQAPF
jgi:single-strand DNA-binding protein